MTTDPGALRAAVLSKGLMNDAYYMALYGERVPPGEPPIDHYVRVGHDLGYAPCGAFDPVLHEMLHGPTPPSDWPALAEAEQAARPAFEHFPDLNLQVYYFHGKPLEELKANVGEFLANPTRPVKLPTPYGVYKFRNPASSEIFKWIREGRPFALARLPHGLWDCSTAVDRVCEDLRADPRARTLSDAQRRALSVRILASRMPRHGNFAGDYLDTIMDDLRDHPREPNFFTGISFKGTPSPEDSAFGSGPPTEQQLRTAARFMEHFSPHDRLYDAMVVKRWAILGGLRELPEILRPRPVVVVARELFGALEQKLDLPRFVLVDVPSSWTQLIRRQMLARIEATIQDQLDRYPSEAPIVLFQSGASLTYWFIRRLRVRFPEVTFLDIGEALSIWMLEESGTNLWIRPYWEQIRKASLADYPDAAPVDWARS